MNESTQPVSPDRFRELLDACWKARKATEMMPELPDGLWPRHITVLDAIHIIGDVAPVRVGDIAAFLHVSDPGVTKMIQELTALGLVSKHPDPHDGRVVNLASTQQGCDFRNHYFVDYHERLCRALAGVITDEDCLTTVRTIDHLADALNTDMQMREATVGTITRIPKETIQKEAE